MATAKVTPPFLLFVVIILTPVRSDLPPSFLTQVSMISDEGKGKEYVEEQAHGSGDDRGAEALPAVAHLGRHLHGTEKGNKDLQGSYFARFVPWPDTHSNRKHCQPGCTDLPRGWTAKPAPISPAATWNSGSCAACLAVAIASDRAPPSVVPTSQGRSSLFPQFGSSRLAYLVGKKPSGAVHGRS
jgi:hypothetical protein